MIHQYLDKSGAKDLTVGILDILKRNPNVLADTTFNWDAKRTYKSEKNILYIYTDYQVDEQGNEIPGIKIGDGSSYLIDMPFITAIYDEHIADTTVHVTPEEKEFWNNKVRCYMNIVDDENVIFTTN